MRIEGALFSVLFGGGPLRAIGYGGRGGCNLARDAIAVTTECPRGFDQLLHAETLKYYSNRVHRLSPIRSGRLRSEPPRPGGNMTGFTIFGIPCR